VAEGERPLLPELTRSLRTLGRPDDAGTDAAHAVVFGPLLDARARAGRGEAADAVAALRGAALAARIESLARTAATSGEGEAARARARWAAAREVLEPLRAELATLDGVAADALRGGAGSPEWGRWTAQLRRVFAAADVACHALAPVLGAPRGVAAPRPRRWFGWRSGSGQ
jgi:hypothetical protein